METGDARLTADKAARVFEAEVAAARAAKEPRDLTENEQLALALAKSAAELKDAAARRRAHFRATSSVGVSLGPATPPAPEAPPAQCGAFSGPTGALCVAAGPPAVLLLLGSAALALYYHRRGRALPGLRCEPEFDPLKVAGAVLWYFYPSRIGGA